MQLQPVFPPGKLDKLASLYQSDGFVHIQNALSADLVFYLKEISRLTMTNDVLHYSEENYVLSAVDNQHSRYLYNPPHAQALSLILTQLYSSIANKPLVPSYAFYRGYVKNNGLNMHIDRPACQYSLTYMVDSDADKCWPFRIENLDGKEFQITNQKPGDIILYQGERVWHGRDCLPHEWSNHVFLHWVDSSDPAYKPHIADRLSQDSYK